MSPASFAVILAVGALFLHVNLSLDAVARLIGPARLPTPLRTYMLFGSRRDEFRRDRIAISLDVLIGSVLPLVTILYAAIARAAEVGPTALAFLWLSFIASIAWAGYLVFVVRTIRPASAHDSTETILPSALNHAPTALWLVFAAISLGAAGVLAFRAPALDVSELVLVVPAAGFLLLAFMSRRRSR